MARNGLICDLIKFILIVLGVYVSFRYFLPLVLPFLLAFLFMRWIFPKMERIHQNRNVPKIFSHYGFLIVSLLGFIGFFVLLLWKVLGQLQLLFTNFPIYKQIFEQNFYRNSHYICRCIDQYLGLDMGTSTAFLEEQFHTLANNCISIVSKQAGKTLMVCLSSSVRGFMFAGFFLVSLFLLIKELEPLQQATRKTKYYLYFHQIYTRMKNSGFMYLKTEGIIILINWFICSFALFLIRNPYFFLIGAVIALFDALPVIGSGCFLVPWAICCVVNGKYISALVLILAYVTTLFAREFLEAKLLGKGMGINPFLILLSIYVGIRLLGVMGIIYGPLGAVLIQTCYKFWMEEDFEFPYKKQTGPPGSDPIKEKV